MSTSHLHDCIKWRFDTLALAFALGLEAFELAIILGTFVGFYLTFTTVFFWRSVRIRYPCASFLKCFLVLLCSGSMKKPLDLAHKVQYVALGPSLVVGLACRKPKSSHAGQHFRFRGTLGPHFRPRCLAVLKSFPLRNSAGIGRLGNAMLELGLLNQNTSGTT